MNGGDGLGRHYPDQDTANQARSSSTGDGVEFSELFTGRCHRAGNDRVNVLEVRAGGNFRNYAAVGLVFLDL